MATHTSTPQTDRSQSQMNISKSASPTKSRSNKRYMLTGLALIAVVGLALGANAALNWRTESRLANLVDKYTVIPRDFNVVLKEKGELQAALSTDIKCEVEGRSTIISIVEEGKAVKKGDLLIELASDEINNRILQEELKESNAQTAYEAAVAELEIQQDKNASDIRKAQLDIELKELAREKYEKGDWVQRHKDAEVAIEEAQIRLERAKENYEASKELRKRNFITQTEFETDEFNHQKAIWELDKAKRAKDVLEKYTHVADLRQRQSDVEEALKELDRVKKSAKAEETKKLRAKEGKSKELVLTRDQLAKLRNEKKKCLITAPAKGFVVYGGASSMYFMSMDGEGQIKEGASVRERQTLLRLPDTSKMIVNIRVHEAKMNKLHIGQRANIEVEGVPDKQFTGTLTKIAVLADTQNRWLNPDLKEYQTEITLDPTDTPLKPGATAHVEVLVESVEHALAVPVQSIYAKSGRRFVFLDNDGHVESMPIELGATSTEWAQITKGLTEGDRVLLAFTDDHKRLVDDIVSATEATDKTSSRQPSPSARRHAGAMKTSMPKHGRTRGAKNEQVKYKVKRQDSGGSHRLSSGQYKTKDTQRQSTSSGSSRSAGKNVSP